jgi:hypothetical protein
MLAVDASSGAMQIRSSTSLHFTARVSGVEDSPASKAGDWQQGGERQTRQGRLSADAMRAKATQPTPSAHLYASLQMVGLDYGPSFRLLDQCMQGEQGALSHRHGCWGKAEFQNASAASSCLTH